MALVVTFVGGLVILRQTHAIWEMDSPNAVSVNCSLNTVFGTGYVIEGLVLIVLVAFVLIALTMCVSRGF